MIIQKLLNAPKGLIPATVLILSMVGCTTVTYEDADGNKAKMQRFQPWGEEVDFVVDIDGLGEASLKKTQEGNQLSEIMSTAFQLGNSVRP